MFDKIKGFLADDAIFYGLLILLIGVASFGLGRWSVVENGSNTHSASVSLSHSSVTPVVRGSISNQTAAGSAENLETRQFVASKNGTKYHRLNCPGAKQMSEQNKIYFTTKTEAESSGYQPAANCPGI